MKFSVVIVGMLFAASLSAQTAGNLYFGYSFVSNNLHVDKFLGEDGSYSANGRGNLNGWNLSGEMKVFRWIGVAADVNGSYGSVPIDFVFNPVVVQNHPTSINTNFYTFLFGPRVSVQVGKIRPFAEVLVGLASQKLDLGGSLPDSEHDHNLATAYGGGLDYRVSRRLAWRVQADYVASRLFQGLQINTFSTPVQHNFRFSTGIVFRF